MDPATGAAARSKVMILGDAHVGKTSLVRRLCGEEPPERYKETLGISVAQVGKIDSGELDAPVRTFDLWCCCGAPRYLPIVQQNYADTSIFVLVYDVTSVTSVQRCAFWRNEILRCCPSGKIMLVGNKVDLEDLVRVSEESGIKQAESWGVAHYRLSCKTGSGLEEFRTKLLA